MITFGLPLTQFGKNGQLYEDVSDRQLKLAGDGRADSPGYKAKFGTYSLLDVESNKVLHFEFVQSNEVSGSCRMALEGLKRCLTFLKIMDWPPKHSPRTDIHK